MKPWRGIPREEIPWYPTIDPDRCTSCRTCVDFCKNDVLELDEDAGKSRVKNPYNCVVECSTCGKLCPESAIRFPDEATFSAFIKERIARILLGGWKLGHALPEVVRVSDPTPDSLEKIRRLLPGIDLIPVKPLSNDEETIREIYRSRLSPLYRKLKG